MRRRALTLALLDRVGEKVRKVFSRSEKEMPLVVVLEGGTWKVILMIALYNFLPDDLVGWSRASCKTSPCDKRASDSNRIRRYSVLDRWK
jgi:hypothetical protein